MALLSTIDSNDYLDVKADVKTIAHTKCKPFLVGVMCWFKNGESFRVFYLFIFSLFIVSLRLSKDTRKTCHFC